METPKAPDIPDDERVINADVAVRTAEAFDPGEFGEYAYDWTGWTGIEFK